jgi:lipopolysaccharide cholinephosphotransferase
MTEQEKRNEQVKSKLLEIFKKLVSVLDEYGLKYCSCGGTTLGAVRHKGFIPWDDDIDIYMPRSDYRKLIALRDQIKRSGYDVVSMDDDGYIYPFAKFVDTNTTVWESSAYRMLFCLYNEIFPLDEFSCSDKELTAIQHRCDRLLRRYQKSMWHFNLKNALAHFPDEAKPVVYFYRHLCPKHYLRQFQQYEQSYVGGSGERCVCVSQWEGKIFRSEWFRQTEKSPFEDTEIIIPSQVDKYLTVLYGDYMKLPPEPERLIHERLYVNLSEGLTLKAVKQRIKNGEHFHA